jgi:hypothetical protein
LSVWLLRAILVFCYSFTVPAMYGGFFGNAGRGRDGSDIAAGDGRGLLFTTWYASGRKMDMTTDRSRPDAGICLGLTFGLLPSSRGVTI